jgi:hypothetical protein
MKRNPVTRQTREMDRRANLAVRAFFGEVTPTADALAVNTVGHNRDTGCDTSGEFYTCGIIGFSPFPFTFCADS